MKGSKIKEYFLLYCRLVRFQVLVSGTQAGSYLMASAHAWVKQPMLGWNNQNQIQSVWGLADTRGYRQRFILLNYRIYFHLTSTEWGLCEKAGEVKRICPSLEGWGGAGSSPHLQPWLDLQEECRGWVWSPSKEKASGSLELTFGLL